MAELEAWDAHLEDITGALGAMLGDTVRGHATLSATGGWTAGFRAHGRSVTASLRHRDGASAAPGDYALALLYGCDYSSVADEGRPAGFAKTLTVRDGFGWDEQMLREFVLEVLGLFRFALGNPDATNARFDATLAEASPSAPRKRRSIPGRKKSEGRSHYGV